MNDNMQAASHINHDETIEEIRHIMGDFVWRRFPDIRSLLKNILQLVDKNGLIWKTAEGFAFTPPEREVYNPWIATPGSDAYKTESFPCWYLDGILFKNAYQNKKLPYHCKNCYKVKVQVDTLGELLALQQLAPCVPCSSKCGLEIDKQSTQSIWSGYFYTDGLKRAFEIHEQIADLITNRPQIGNDHKTFIKRGCTHFEMACGPSNRWRFDENLERFEKELFHLFEPPPEIKCTRQETYLGWIELAYSIGDDSYLALTNGKRLHPKTVNYLELNMQPPNEPDDRAAPSTVTAVRP